MGPDAAAVGEFHFGQKTFFTTQKAAWNQGTIEAHRRVKLICGKKLKSVPDPEPALDVLVFLWPVFLHLALEGKAPTTEIIFEAGTQAHNQAILLPQEGELVSRRLIEKATQSHLQVGKRAVIHGIPKQVGRLHGTFCRTSRLVTIISEGDAEILRKPKSSPLV
jgi:hypothetical protein